MLLEKFCSFGQVDGFTYLWKSTFRLRLGRGGIMHGSTLSAFESSNYLRGREIIPRPHSFILYRPPNSYWMEITCPNVPNNALGGSNVRASTMYIADFIIGVSPKNSICYKLHNVSPRST
jgi:hypothetical protein